MLIFIHQAYPPGGIIFTGIGVLLSVSLYVDHFFQVIVTP
jgi:hypothetical protein